MDKALRLLTRRAHATADLRRKLLDAGFSVSEIRQTIRELEQRGLLNDTQIASDRARSLGERNYGARRIQLDLRKHRLETALPEEDRAELAVTEPDRALQAAKAKARLLRSEKDPRKKREKLLRFLLTRGFAPGIAFDAVDCVLREDDESQFL